MNIRVRNNLFETNSSSAHVFTITKKNSNKYFTGKDKITSIGYQIDDGVYEIKGKSFDRDVFQVLTNPYEKAEYVLACMCKEKYDSIYVKVLTSLQELDGSLTEIKFPIKTDREIVCSKQQWDLIDWLNKFKIGRYLLKFNDSYKIIVTLVNNGYGFTINRKKQICAERAYENVECSGYVPQKYLLPAFMEEYNLDVRDIVLRKDIIIICDNDEICVYTNMKEHGLIKPVTEYSDDNYFENKKEGSQSASKREKE